MAAPGFPGSANNLSIYLFSLMAVDILRIRIGFYAPISVGVVVFIAIAKGVRAIASARPTVVGKAIGPNTFHFCLQWLPKLFVH